MDAVIENEKLSHNIGILPPFEQQVCIEKNWKKNSAPVYNDIFVEQQVSLQKYHYTNFLR